MRQIGLLAAACCCVLAGCSAGDAPGIAANSLVHEKEQVAKVGEPIRLRQSAIAPLPDQGRLLSYEPEGVVRKGTVTWRPVALSEAHALNAVVGGEMVFNTPEGDAVRLRYQRHVEHADGNWSWVGNAGDGQQAVITFGEKAVFGVIPYGNGKSMEISTVAGRTWVVDGTTSEPAKAAADAIIPDASLVADASASGKMRLAAAGMQAESLESANMRAEGMPTSSGLAPAAIGPSALTTIDLLVGYTSGFATRLGGTSQALTRVTFMVDLANTAYSDSQVQGRLRLVGAQQVDYPDATTNQSALFDLSGVTCVAAPGGQLPDRGVACTNVTPPAALQPLLSARQTLGADVVSLVRTFQSPENGSCGYAWLLGNSQQPIDPVAASRFGLSVVSDSSGTTFPDNGATCRHDTLAHELGHLMGLQHDRVTAAGGDDTNGDSNNLDPEEFGRYADSFGYRTDDTAGNFATIMASRLAGQGSFRVFSNPRISTCSGFACGQAGVADNAATLVRTMPVVESFMPSRTLTANNWLQGDFDGDRRADVLWHNLSTGTNVYWKGANAQTRKGLSSNGDIAWAIAGVGDFNGDSKSDILWRNRSTGSNIYWRSADSATRKGIGTLDLAWNVAGIADFDGDGADDILWRNSATGVNTIWKQANVLTRINVATLEAPWIAAGVGDFDLDGKSDILWRNPLTGLNSIWKAGAAGNRIVTSVAVQWSAAAVGDLNGDGRSDIVWRNTTTGANLVWWSGDPATRKALTTMADVNWCIVGVGDYNNDGKADLLWRHSVTGANTVWWSGTTAQTLAASGLVWIAS